MSQFDLPRINFHGTAILDTATANNGNYEPSLMMFDQNESEAFLPPRCYLPDNYTYIPPPGIVIEKDAKGSFVRILPITADNYQQWAITPLGSFKADALYLSLYTYLSILGVNPGYWNYFGDLSMSLVNTQVTGITLPNIGGGVVTYTPQNQNGCPSDFAEMFGAELSFNNDFFAVGSRTSAYLSDADSIGQMCTQIFCGQAGLYKTDANGKQITFFSGKPVKSTGRWMNLSKVLNYADGSLIPMGGSASFYAKISLNDGSDLATMIQQETNKPLTGLFLKMLIHEVHEVREPDYTKVPTKNITDIFGNQSTVQKNPAIVSVSGSITPYYDGDMQTISISRLLKSNSPITISTSTNNPIKPPITKGGTQLTNASTVNLAPIQFIHNPQLNLLSFDVINTINEYGTNPPPITNYPYAGPDDIPAFQNFESYNYGSFSIVYKSDIGDVILNIGSIDFASGYNMQQLLANGGVIDFKVAPASDFSGGSFYITLNEINVFEEDDYLITTDQMGNYAQQNQTTNNYMSDGLPRIPCTLRVFRRGIPVTQNENFTVTKQKIDMRNGIVLKNTEDLSVYDFVPMNFAVNEDGCKTYAFIHDQSNLWNGTMPTLFKFAMNTSLVVVRTLESDLTLNDYLTGKSTITWDVVFKNVFSLFKVLYPVMDAVIPLTEANWSNPIVLNKMLVLIDDSNWNQPLYMPVTRDLSAQQQQLLTMWANQIINNTPAH